VECTNGKVLTASVVLVALFDCPICWTPAVTDEGGWIVMSALATPTKPVPSRPHTHATMPRCNEIRGRIFSAFLEMYFITFRRSAQTGRHPRRCAQYCDPLPRLSMMK